MNASLLFSFRDDIALRFGGKIKLFMDCYKIHGAKNTFADTFVFSWIAFEENRPERRVLMDQHQGRPCHLHIGDQEIELWRAPNSLAEAYFIFKSEVRNFFGELEVK